MTRLIERVNISLVSRFLILLHFFHHTHFLITFLIKKKNSIKKMRLTLKEFYTYICFFFPFLKIFVINKK